MRIIGYYNEYGYRIFDCDKVEDIHTAGNSPWESTAVVSLDKAVCLDIVKSYCQDTLKEMAREKQAKIVGIEYEESDCPE